MPMILWGFQHRTEAERFLEQFRERLAKFGLELHADKTRLIEFGRNAARSRKQRGKGKPETFTFLGFTHYCGKRRSNGSFIVWRKTAKKRMVAKLHAIKAELIRQKHEPTALVGKWLRQVTLVNRMAVFMHHLRRMWRAVLARRSQRGQVSWQRHTPLL